MNTGASANVIRVMLGITEELNDKTITLKEIFEEAKDAFESNNVKVDMEHITEPLMGVVTIQSLDMLEITIPVTVRGHQYEIYFVKDICVNMEL